MFGLLKSNPVPVIAPVVVIPPQRPTRLTNRPTPISDFDKYTALASELETGAVLRGHVLQRQIADFLWENDIEMYSYSAVDTYLKARAQAIPDSMYRWRGLRDCDGEDGWGWEHELKAGGYYWKGKWECRTYDGIVPFDVLENVKALDAAFPKKLHFFVSDIKSDPDPFIVVCARDTNRIVFGAWDEPEFFRSESPSGV